MLIIPVKEGENIDRALKRFKRKFDRTKTMWTYVKENISQNHLLPKELKESKHPMFKV